jgi:mevalonate kinase
MEQVVCSVPGKIILTGEHSVVYGKPALLSTVGLRTKAEIKRIENPVIRLFSDKLSGSREESLDFVLKFWIKARRAWEEFVQSDDYRKLDALKKDKFVVMLSGVGLCLEEVGSFNGGLEVKIQSQLPIISGFGSSAYVAAAVIGGVGLLFDRHWNQEELNNLVYEIEKIMHGKPSGGDSTVVINGGFIKFQKINEKFKFKQLTVERDVIPKALLINSGIAAESTAEMVSKVTEGLRVDHAKFKGLIDKMGRLSEMFVDSLEDGRFELEVINENQRLLEELGVVGRRARKMIQLIKSEGGAAKISGGGGVEEGSGVLIAFHNDVEKLGKLITKKGWESFNTELGGEGWQIE